MAAESTYIKNSIQGTVTLYDGSGVPNSLALAYDDGNVKITNLGQVLNELVKVRRRGKRVSEAWGEKLDPVVTLSVLCGNVIGGSAVKPGTPWEFLTFKNAYSGNVSTSANAAGVRPKTVALELKIRGTDVGDASDEVIRLNDLYVMGEFSEGMQGNRLSFSAEVLGTVQHTVGGITTTYSGI